MSSPPLPFMQGCNNKWRLVVVVVQVSGAPSCSTFNTHTTLTLLHNQGRSGNCTQITKGLSTTTPTLSPEREREVLIIQCGWVAVVVMGPEGVGKSCLVKRLARTGAFEERYQTTVGPPRKYDLAHILHGQPHQVQLYDTSRGLFVPISLFGFLFFLNKRPFF